MDLLLTSALRPQGHLELCLEDRERGAQLVASVHRERPLTIQSVLQAIEHLVERLAERTQLIARDWGREALRVVCRDPGGLAAHALHRS